MSHQLPRRAALAAALLALVGWPPLPATTVEAVVLRSPTEAVAGAVVELVDAGGETVREGRADRFGLASLGDLDPGRYGVRVGGEERGEVEITGERAFLLVAPGFVEAAALELRVAGEGEGVTVEVVAGDGAVVRSAVTGDPPGGGVR